MMTGNKALTNPYVGPRAFEQHERRYFFGRDQETKILTGLVMAHRTSLFFAQSGAGKSSLLRAGLIPILTRKQKAGRGARARLYQKMSVLPILTVGKGIPLEMEKPITNIYIFSAILGLLPNTAPNDLADLSLADALQHCFEVDKAADQANETQSAKTRPPLVKPDATLLIFDQFEEMFTTHPDHWRKREGFFNQVNEALSRCEELHVLFTMREDYIAELTPYANLLPEKLRHRFRLERLQAEAALQAVKQPAKALGRTYAEHVAEDLVDNLRRTQPGPRNRAVAEAETTEPASDHSLGAYIEPVHLQIVCRQLWSNLPADQTVIQAKDVREFGDVDEALIGFYEDTLCNVIASKNIDLSERQLRTWFTEELITPARTKGLVYRGDKKTEGLPNPAVEILNDAYLIRADIRGNDTWYELAHDRLVEPILEANRRWEVNYYNPLAIAAQAWLDSGRNVQKLIKGEQLTEAETYAQAYPQDVTEPEEEFLLESKRQEQAKNEAALQAARRQRNGIIMAIVVIAALILLTIWGFSSASSASKAATAAQAANTAANQERDRAATAESTAQAASTAAIVERDNANAQRSLAQAASTAAIQQQLTAEAASTAAIVEKDNANTQQATAQAASTAAIQQQLIAEAASTTAIQQQATAQAEATRANNQANISLARGLASQAGNLLDDQYDLALLLNIEANRITDTLTARSNLFAGLERDPRLTTYLRNHTSWVWATGLSPTEPIIAASAGNDRNILLWDIEGRQLLHPPLTGHTNVIWSVAFSPDGQTLASGSSDETIILWDVTSGRRLDTLEGHSSGIKAVAYSPPHGRMLASGDSTGNILLWDVADRQIASRIKAPTDEEVWSLAFGSDGETLVSGNADGQVILWDVATGNKIDSRTISETNEVWSVDLSPDSKLLAIGTSDNQVIIWDLEADRISPLSGGHAAGVRHVAFGSIGQNADGAVDNQLILASAGEDGRIILWDVTNLAAIQQFGEPLLGHGDRVFSLSFGPDGKTLVSGSQDESVILWDISANQRLGLAQTAHNDQVHSVAVNSESQRLASAGKDRIIKLWDISATPPISQPLTGHTSTVYSLDFSPDGQILASGGADSTLRLWDANSAEPISRSVTTTDSPIFGVAISPDGKTLASGHTDNSVTLWDITEPTNPVTSSTLAGHSDWVWDVAFSPDGKTLASGSKDTTIILWDVATKDQIKLEEHSNSVTSIAFSPDRKTMASGSANRKIFLWDVTDPKNPRRIGSELAGHDKPIWEIAFSPDSNRLASISQDGSLILWDVTNRLNPQRLGEALTGHDPRSLGTVAFGPNGRTLISSDAENNLVWWDMDSEAWRTQACNVVTRNLTWKEWSQHLPGAPYRTTCPDLHLTYFEAVKQANTYALAGQSEQAQQAFEEIRKVAEKTDNARLNNLICWSGSLHNFAESVLPACERAVELEPDNKNYRESRGLAHALTGNYSAAIEDLEEAGGREDWVADLKAGENPFSPEVLEELKSE